MKTKQNGIALITAMLVSALATLVATNLAWDNSLDVRRTIVNLGRDQAIQIALGAESWVSIMLKEDLQNSQRDHLDEIWAGQLPGLPIEGGEVYGLVEDLQGKFNVNSLIKDDGEVNEVALNQFRRLLEALNVDPKFAGLIADWIDPDSDALFPDGAEDSIYTAIIPPYRTANQKLTSVSEITAVEGMNRQIWKIVEPHITALPTSEGINVNTATPAVLMSLNDSMLESDVERLLTERTGGGFSDIQSTFTPLVPADILMTLKESSEFFRLKVVVRLDTVRITLFSLLHRDRTGTVTTILRSYGTV